MRLAITSTDGKIVNKCFEESDTFFIYEVTGDDKVFIEKRTTEKYSGTIHNLRFKRNRFKKVYEVLQDCSGLVTSSIEQVIVDEFKKYGIATKTCSGMISKINI